MDVSGTVALLRAFGRLDAHLSDARLMLLLMVAQRGECAQKELEMELGLHDGTATATVSYWTDDIQKKTGLPGWGFIERRSNPVDRRIKIISLTPKGREFFEELLGSWDGRLDG